MDDTAITALINHFESLDQKRVAELSRYYAFDAYFKDPFNEVMGIKNIEHAILRIYEITMEPHFVVTERFDSPEGVILSWNFHFRFRFWLLRRPRIVQGISHLKFNADGKIIYHRNYWDSGEEVYEKLPIISWFIRRLRRIIFY